MTDPKARGRFVWYELNTSDPEGAKTFYTNVVGWGTAEWEDAGPDMPPYSFWMNGEDMVGGVGKLQPEMESAGVPPHWIGYVGTPDVDATAAQAQELGANVVVPPMDIPTIGRFAILTDPQSAMFAAFTSADHAPGHEGAPNPGEFSWHELATTDYESAFDFYSALFGWEKGEAVDMGPAGSYQIFTRNGQQVGGMYNKTADMQVEETGAVPGPPAWSYYAMVTDLDGRVERIKAGGGQVMAGPMEVPGGDRVIIGMDPQGAVFALHSRAQ